MPQKVRDVRRLKPLQCILEEVSVTKGRRAASRSGAQGGCISRVAGRQLVVLLLGAVEVGSRNVCERAIREGRVQVNGRPVANDSARADPAVDTVALDGVPVDLSCTCRYLAFNKPYRVMCSFTDSEGRATVRDYVPVEGVYAAGRLDYDSEGLMILTDDGWLNHRLTHPRYNHPKTYWVQVEGVPDEEALQALCRGVLVKGQRTLPAEAELLESERVPRVPPRSVPIRYRKNIPTAWLCVVLREGKKRQVRHMTAAVGHPTLRLLRVAMGPVSLGDLAPGEYRELSDEELAALAEQFRRPPRQRRDYRRRRDGGRSSRRGRRQR